MGDSIKTIHQIKDKELVKVNLTLNKNKFQEFKSKAKVHFHSSASQMIDDYIGVMLNLIAKANKSGIKGYVNVKFELIEDKK